MRLGLLVTAGMLAVPAVAWNVPAAVAVPTCGGLPATIVGTPHADDIVGTDADDVVWLGAGDDTFQGGLGDDRICGGEGEDILRGSEGDDRVFGGRRNDQLEGGPGRDRLFGGAEADVFIEGAGNDRLSGGSGNDLVDYYAWDQSGLRLDAARRVATGAGHDRFVSIQSYDGTYLDDVMLGSPGRDDLRSYGGVDRILGYGGDDYLEANAGVVKAGRGNDNASAGGRVRLLLGSGNDGVNVYSGKARVVGGPGDDSFSVNEVGVAGRVDGGRGYDNLLFYVFPRAVRVDLEQGTARWQGGGSRVTSMEKLDGSKHADVLIGSAGRDEIDGFLGNDTLRGGGGNDILTGSNGSDLTDGGNGFDRCDGERKASCEALPGY